MIRIKKIKFAIFLTLIINFFLNIENVNAQIYEEIKVEGNERLSVETIIMFSGLDIQKNISLKELNLSIKKLYKTDYFKDIKMNSENKTLNISIIENPIIQSIKINGIKNKSILDEVLKFTDKNEKYPFLINKTIEQNNLLLNIARASGFYFAEIETKILDNKDNSVDIIYNFSLGSRATIKKIKFQGDKKFKDSKLRNIISSEEGRFWKFITSNKYLDERKIKNDETLLKRYYQQKGYYNVKVKSSYAKNINNQYFELIFNIDAGEKYYFNELSIQISKNFDKDNFIDIKKKNKKS